MTTILGGEHIAGNKVTRAEWIRARLMEIIKEYNGLESNVPVGPKVEYWMLKNELSSLLNKNG